MFIFSDMLERVKIENLVPYLIYGMEGNENIMDSYEERIQKSYDIFFKKIEEMYPKANGDDDDLFCAVTNFATTHDDVYFESGMLVGFQLYKNMEQRYKKYESDGMQGVLRKENARNMVMNKRTELTSLLEKLFEMQIDSAIEEALKKDQRYQTMSVKAEQKLEKLGKIELTHEQEAIIDDALATCNKTSSEYGRVMYDQGFKDAINLLEELYQLL